MKQGSTGCWLLAALLLLLCSSVTAQAQRKEKGKKNEPLVALPDEQLINNGVSEMLAAWQIGDVGLLHKHYADDVMVVSGAWEPPLMGWAKYLQAYQAQRERMQNADLDRRNTFIKVLGNIAWAVYQWQFSAVVDGKSTGARGHTTLILEKRNGLWLIVQNHTSIVAEPAPPKPAQSPAGVRPGA